MKLEEGFDSSYRYVLVAARRARQLQNGSRPLIDARSTKACRVAQEEIAAGKVKFTLHAQSAVGQPGPIAEPQILAEETGN